MQLFSLLMEDPGSRSADEAYARRREPGPARLRSLRAPRAAPARPPLTPLACPGSAAPRPVAVAAPPQMLARARPVPSRRREPVPASGESGGRRGQPAAARRERSRGSAASPGGAGVVAALCVCACRHCHCYPAYGSCAQLLRSPPQRCATPPAVCAPSCMWVCVEAAWCGAVLHVEHGGREGWCYACVCLGKTGVLRAGGNVEYASRKQAVARVALSY